MTEAEKRLLRFTIVTLRALKHGNEKLTHHPVWLRVAKHQRPHLMELSNARAARIMEMAISEVGYDPRMEDRVRTS